MPGQSVLFGFGLSKPEIGVCDYVYGTENVIQSDSNVNCVYMYRYLFMLWMKSSIYFQNKPNER